MLSITAAEFQIGISMLTFESGGFFNLHVSKIIASIDCILLHHFSVLWVLRCSAGIDGGCQVISGFHCHLGLTNTLLGLDLMLILIQCQTN